MEGLVDTPKGYRYKEYKEINTFILNKSSIIIQDDSGIPYRFFHKDKWKIKLFGSYVEPVKLKDLPDQEQQKKLAKDFKNKSRDLPFNFGYGAWDGPGRSNLMLLIKKE